MKIGYARVSTDEQKLDAQLDALKKDGCEKIYKEKRSGGKKDRPILEECLNTFSLGMRIKVAPTLKCKSLNLMPFSNNTKRNHD